MHRITPCLWFDSQAEDAARFYTSVFPDSGIGRISRYGKEGHEIHGRPEGSVMTVEFELDGQRFTALNGGPVFKFNEAVSFQVYCESQEEVDRYWEKLSEGGDPRAQQCGWLKDRYGVSWQVVPTALIEMLQDKDARRTERVMKAMLPMIKLDSGSLSIYRERTMKYLCLVYLDEKRLDEVPDEQCVAFDQSIRNSGHCIASEALESVQTATTVRVRNGKLAVTDGPFAETKEQLAGFYMIDAHDLNEAIQLASKIPPARVGSIEVRPIRPIRENVRAQTGRQTANLKRSG